MRATGIFFAYLFACLLLAALLTWPLVQTGWIGYDPHRVMSRLAQLLILIGLWPFLKAMGLASRDALGYGAPRPVILGAVWRGWLAGVAILLVLSAALLALGVRVPEALTQAWAGDLAARAAKALIGGLLIGLLEETFFRGALFAAVRRRGGAWSAILWTAGLYALLHFMKPGPLPDGVPFDAAGAAQMFVEVFTGVAQWKHVDSMAALFLVGVFLGLVRERTRHIGWCIGLHAGWVFVIQVTRHLTDDDPAAATAWLAGDYDGVIGWLAALWIGLLALAYWVRSRRRQQTAATEA
jgi:membrane protease YdiL (CAAX protease family)